MSNGHFSTSGPYRFDSEAAFLRAQQEERRVRDRIVRAELHLMTRLAGMTFASEQALHEYVVALAERLGYQMDAELVDVIRKASHNLWSDSARFRMAGAA